MSKPESIKIDPWTEWPKLPYSIITDDFVHDKLLTWKVNSKGSKSTLNFKANIKQDKGALKLSDEIKYWFALPEGRSFYSKVKSSDYLKLHFDNGIIERWNKKWNLYATLNVSKTLTNASLRFGAAHKSQHCNSDSRVKVDFLDENKYDLTWYNRAVVTKDKFTFGKMTVFNISSKVLAKTNFLFGYKVNDKVDAFLRIENNDYRKHKWGIKEITQHLDTFKFDIVGKHDEKVKYGLEVKNTLFRPFLGKEPAKAHLMKPWLSLN